MTEYGRGPGSEPWYPEDPLYGDLGYAGQQTPEAPDPYGAQTGTGQYPQYQQYEDAAQHDTRAQYDSPYGAPAQYDPQYPPQQPAQPYAPQEYQGYQDQQGYLDQQGYQNHPQGYRDQQGLQDYGSWGTGAHPAAGHPQTPGEPAGYPGPGPDTLGGQPAHPYPGGQGPGPTGQGAPYQGDAPGPPEHGRPGAPGPYRDPGAAAGPGAYGGPGWDTGHTGRQGPAAHGAGEPGAAPHGHHAEEPLPGAPGPGAPAPGPRPGARRRRPAPQSAPEPAPEPLTDWDPGPDQGEHAFFAGGDDDDGDDRDDDRSAGRGGRRGRGGERRGGGGRKRRSGAACLVMSVALVGVVGGVGYAGYRFYENHFGPPPDFAGDGTGTTVTVVVPKGAGGYTIGQLLKDKGVVKSVDAFVEAQKNNPKGQSIQDGVYTLHPQMSGEAVVSLMLDPKSRNSLTVAEGRRNTLVYADIDLRLGLKKGTTAEVAKKEWKSLGLPDWARDHHNVKDPLEGFLYPSTYPVDKSMKPEEILKKMVAQASAQYSGLHLKTAAKKLDLDGPWQVITVASLVQAEGKTHDDFRKMAEVVYNRLSPGNTQSNRLLQFDSTFNYLMNESNIKISESEINSNQDPYNTYTRKGLPPGPIGNPGPEALKATLDPTHDGWFYFVAVDGMNKTEFAKTYAEFQKLKDKFNDSGHG